MNVVVAVLPIPWRLYFGTLEEVLLRKIPNLAVYTTQFLGLRKGADVSVATASAAPGMAGPIMDLMTTKADLSGVEITAVYHCARVRRQDGGGSDMVLSIAGLAEDRSYRAVLRDFKGKDITAEVAAAFEADTGIPWDRGAKSTGDTFWDLVEKRRAG
jgi:hypothetical protein